MEDFKPDLALPLPFSTECVGLDEVLVGGGAAAEEGG